MDDEKESMEDIREEWFAAIEDELDELDASLEGQSPEDRYEMFGKPFETKPGVYVTNPERMREFRYAYLILKHTVVGNKGTEVKLEVVDKYMPQTMSIILTGSDIAITKPKLFRAAMQLASSYILFPRADGVVEMEFTFGGVTNRGPVPSQKEGN